MLRDELGGWGLVIAAADGTRHERLTPGTSQVLGRDSGADIRIDDASISRRHAILHVGERLEIEDVGSSNGTFVHGERIDVGRRVELSPGDFFEVGTVVCAVRGVPVRGARTPQLRPHSYFETRLKDAIDEARELRHEVAVVRLRVDDDSDALIDGLFAAVSPGDVVAQYAPREYELLLINSDAAGLDQVLERFRELGVAELGHAAYPADARSAAELFSIACDAMRGDDEIEVGSKEPIIENPTMRQLHGLLARVARGGVNVLLLGETGVGKEIFAERLHRVSPRAEKPLCRLNCAAFSETLLESELFGHERGAFTGASARKVGLIESADGGTVFLDEVGELGLSIQAKLLRVIEAGTLRRVGGGDEISVDVVYIAATNRELDQEMAAGRFRADLFYRLNGFSLRIPPLRERRDEIVPLAESFIRAATTRLGEPRPPRLTDRARARLLSYPWPGNIRELKNATERAVLLSAGDVIDDTHLPLSDELADPRDEGIERAISQRFNAPAPENLSEDQQAERQRIIDALSASHGNQTRAAAMLGISRRWLSTKMARYKIPRARDR